MIRRWVHLVLALGTVLGLSAQDPRTLRPQQDGGRAGAPEKRVALLIGNAAYAEGPLRNPVNDARAMKAALEGSGFEVVLKENASKRDMQDAIRAFGDRIHGGAVGLFYFAGHGVQVKGVNHLVPVGARIEREDEVPYEAVELGLVLDKMESAGNRLNILILDACRNNPFARSWRGAGERGLAQVKAPTGTMIAYATAPGSTAADGDGSNGIYTEALLAQIREPGVELERMFKRVRERVLEASQGRQTPWESNSTIGDFCFVPGKAAGGASPEAPPPAAPAVAVATTEVGDRIAAYERGEKEHAFDIGMAFLEGTLGTPKSYTKAKEWLSKAAAHGDKDAYVELGDRYLYGQGTKANPKEAMKWFRKSAEAGDPKGLEKVGDLFYTGDGTPQNRAEAVKWYRKAVEKGERPEAAMRLGKMYYTGDDGVPANTAEAVKWFRLADSCGAQAASYYLGRIYEYGGTGVPANAAEALGWMERGANNHYSLSIFDMGRAYAEGRLIAPDPVEAFKWLTVFIQMEPNPTEAEELLKQVTARLSPANLERAWNEAAEPAGKLGTAKAPEGKA